MSSVLQAPVWRGFRPGIITLVVSMGAATGALLPLRNSLSLAAAALVFVLPVVGAMLLEIAAERRA